MLLLFWLLVAAQVSQPAQAQWSVLYKSVGINSITQNCERPDPSGKWTKKWKPLADEPHRSGYSFPCTYIQTTGKIHAISQGSITAVLSWSGGDEPPSEVLIREESGATAEVEVSGRFRSWQANVDNGIKSGVTTDTRVDLPGTLIGFVGKIGRKGSQGHRTFVLKNPRHKRVLNLPTRRLSARAHAEFEASTHIYGADVLILDAFTYYKVTLPDQADPDSDPAPTPTPAPSDCGGPRQWDAGSPIAGAIQSTNVTLAAAGQAAQVGSEGRYSLQVTGASDSDHWTGCDTQNVEADGLTYLWTCTVGSFEATGGRSQRVTGPSVVWVSPPGYNGDGSVTCTINDVGAKAPGDGGSRDDAPLVKTIPFSVIASSNPPANCLDGSCGAVGGNLPVDLSTGRETLRPQVDLGVYNAYGPGVTWSRHWNAFQAQMHHASPGLPEGWTHPYDVWLEQPLPGDYNITDTRGVLVLHYSSGAVDIIRPGQGEGSRPAGRSFFVTGQPSAGTGPSWGSVAVVWADGSRWEFRPQSAQGSTAYALWRQSNATGQFLAFNYGSGRRLVSISDGSSGVTLLSLDYGNSGGMISGARDVYGRRVSYMVQPLALTQASEPARYYLFGVRFLAPVATPVNAVPLYKTYRYTSRHDALRNWDYLLVEAVSEPHPNGESAADGTGGSVTTTAAYDELGRETSAQDANGNTRSYQYTNSPDAPPGEMLSLSTTVTVTSSAGAVVSVRTHKMDALGREIASVDSRGQTQTRYDDPQNPYKATSVTDALSRTVSAVYDHWGNVVSSRSPRGVVTSYTYAYNSWPMGRLQSVQQSVQAGGQTWSKPARTFTYYEPSGLLQSVTGPHPGGTGQVTASFAYNALGDVTDVVLPPNSNDPNAGPRSVQIGYANDGDYSQPAKRGQPLFVRDPMGHLSHRRYDERGNEVASWDELGNRSDATFDLYDQVQEVLAPASGQTGAGRGRTVFTYAFPGGGARQVAAFDESGTQVRQQSTVYGPEGETVASGGWGEPARYTYDADYRLLTLSDANSAGAGTTRYIYNTDGDLLQAQYPRAEASTGYDTVSYTYAPDHQVASVRDGRGLVATYERNDPEGLLTAENFSNGAQQENASYSYDAWGRPQQMQDGAVAESYAFNASDALESVSTQFRTPGGLSAPYVLGYSYHADGSRAGMQSPGGAFAYSYNSAGQLSGLMNPQQVASSWSYGPNGWLQSQSVGGRLQSRYAYNGLGQLMGLANVDGAGELLSQFGHVPAAGQGFDPQQVLRYDGVGNVLRRVASVPAQPGMGGAFTYAYDAQDQLRGEQVQRPDAAQNQARSWDFDAAGNPTGGSYTPANAPASTWSRTFNAANQETTLGAPGTPLAGQPLYAYDGNGNPTLYKGLAAAYDARDRMTAWGRMRAGYRGDGKRAWKATLDEQGQEVSRRYFLYDGDDLLCEIDGQGRVASTSTWGAGGLLSRAVTSYGAQGASTSTVLYAFDERGNVAERLGVTQVGASVARAAYDTWGSGSDGDSVGFGGQFGYYTDAETGLILCTHRYYDPGAQRWVNRDPLSYNGGINLYSHSANNPVNYVDPDGQVAVPIAAGGIGAVAGAAFGAYSAWRSGGDVWTGTWRGALTGGIAGVTGSWIGGALATSVIGTTLGGVGSGIVTGAASSAAANLALQTRDIIYEERCGYNWGEVGLSAGIGGVTGGFAGRWATTGTTTVSRWGSQGIRSGSWVMPGKATFSNYVRSFKWQKGLGNIYAPPSAGQEFPNNAFPQPILKTDLKWPSGFFNRDGWWKGLFGQRIYRP